MIRRFTQNQKYVVAAVYVSAMILNSLDSTIVNVTLATLGREFGVAASSIESVVVAYLVSLAVFMPASGWLGDRFGVKNVFLVALAVFTIASVLCGFALTLNQLVLYRILQGAGGGLLTPVGMALLFRTFPPAERVGVSRVLMYALVLGPALGPVLGGGILEVASWRWTFWVKVPISAAALFFGWRYLNDERNEEPAERFDLPGFISGGAGLGMLMYALLEGPDLGWSSPAVLGPGLAGVALLTFFVWHELRTRFPMVDLRLLGNRLFFAVIRVGFFGTAGFLGSLFVVPLFLQVVRGESPLTTGLVTAPEALGVVVSSQVVARLYPRVGPRRLMASGLLLVTLAIIWLAFIDQETSLGLIALNMFVIGVGMAFIFLPNQAASMATIERPKLGGASMLYSVQRQLGSAFGVAAMSTVLSIVGVVSLGNGGVEVPNVDAYRAAFLAAAVLTFIGSCWAWLVPDEDAAETMKR